MQKSEKIIFEHLKNKFDVMPTNPVKANAGYPDFKCTNQDGTRVFFVEVKLNGAQLNYNQGPVIKELIGKGVDVYCARVLEKEFVFYKLDSDLGEHEEWRGKISDRDIGEFFKNECNFCKYVWEGRTLYPKACPRCKARLDLKKESDELVRAGLLAQE
jgi:hypothetical protein